MSVDLYIVVMLLTHTKKLLISLNFLKIKNNSLATQIIIKYEDFKSKTNF